MNGMAIQSPFSIWEIMMMRIVRLISFINWLTNILMDVVEPEKNVFLKKNLKEFNQNVHQLRISSQIWNVISPV